MQCNRGIPRGFSRRGSEYRNFQVERHKIRIPGDMSDYNSI